MKAGFLSALLLGCAGATEPTEWAHDDPNRPMIVAVAPSEAFAVGEAARTCGLQNQRRISRSGWEWIVMRDVPAQESKANEGGISGKEALDLAVGIQQQAGENPAYAHVVPITELRPALILREV